MHTITAKPLHVNPWSPIKNLNLYQTNHLCTPTHCELCPMASPQCLNAVHVHVFMLTVLYSRHSVSKCLIHLSYEQSKTQLGLHVIVIVLPTELDQVLY